MLPSHACVHRQRDPRGRRTAAQGGLCTDVMELQGHAEPTDVATRRTTCRHASSSHVGPIVQGIVTPGHARALADCYRSCLDLATELSGVRSISLCGISTGVLAIRKRRPPRLPSAPSQRGRSIPTRLI